MNAGPLLTRETLRHDFAQLGLTSADVVLVHASMGRLGWVCGGAATVVSALLDVTGPGGTIVVPTQTLFNRDPARWTEPSVPEEWWPTIREHLPPYDPHITPSTRMGAIAECVRTWPGAVRSGHPQTSFAAIGRQAALITDDHRLDSPLGEHSPLARLESLDASILLLGVGFDRCTAFHLAEYRQANPVRTGNAAVMRTPDGPRWVSYESVLLDDSDFAILGKDFESLTDVVRHGTIGAAEGRVMRVREAVRFAEGWLPRRRRGGSDDADNADTPGSITTAMPLPHEIPLVDTLGDDDRSPLAMAARDVARNADKPTVAAFQSAV